MNGRRLSVAALSALLVGAAAAGGAVAEELSPTAERAMAQIAACSADADQLLVQVVVDESGSLLETDPTDQRVAGIVSAIDVLAGLRAEAAGELEVELNLALFAERYTELASWAPLDPESAERLRSVASATLPTRDRGAYTDYRAALNGARTSLDARAAALGGTSCKVVLWFTDGALDVRGDGEPAALSEICAPNGVADGLRASGISVVALALFSEVGSVTPEQRAQLRAIAEGAADGVTCGESPVPSDAAAGAYLRADDAGALRRLFAGIGALLEGGTQSETRFCPSDRCADGVLDFPVDRGISGLELIVDAAAGTPAPRLVDPEGDVYDLVAGTHEAPWGTVAVTARDGLTVAELAFDDVDGAHVGPWSADLADLGQATADLFYFWGAQLDVTAPGGLVVGETSDVEVVLSVNGQPVSPSWYEELDVELMVEGVSVLLSESADGLSGTVEFPGEGAPAELVFTATASARSAPSGVRLAPVSATVPLATRLPASFPTIAPTRVTVPTIETLEGSTAVVTLTGSDRGPTRVCLGDVSVAGPADAGRIAVTASPECVDLAADEVRDWTLTVRPESMADGRVAGEVDLVLTGADAGDETTMSVGLTSAMVRPVDEPLRWLLVVGLVLLSLVLPLALLAVSNWWLGRFRLTHLSRVASVPVRVTATGLEPRRADGDMTLIDPDDFGPVGLGEVRRRRFSAGGVEFAHDLPWWPMGDPTAYAEASGGELVISGTGVYSDAQARQAPVQTALGQTWVLLVDPHTVGDDGADARLVFVNEDTGLREVIDARNERLGAFPGWDIVWAKIRAAAEARERTDRRETPTKASAREERTATAGTGVEPRPMAPDLAPPRPAGPSEPPRMTAWEDEESSPAPPSSAFERATTQPATGAGTRRWRGRGRPAAEPRPAGPSSPGAEQGGQRDGPRTSPSPSQAPPDAPDDRRPPPIDF